MSRLLRTLLVSLLVGSVGLIAVLPAVGQTRAQSVNRFDRTVNELISRGWPNRIEKALATFGSAPSPFRIAGSRSDTAAARWVALQMQGMGLTNVRLEAIPVDAWTFSRASVVAGDKTMKASSFAGQEGTPAAGVTGEVVYVGGGTKAEFDAAGDVSGKIALIDCMFGSWWMSTPAMEAESRGCSGLIFTYTATDPTMYSIAPDALGSYDWPASPSTPPAVYLSAQDGDWLKAELRGGPVSVAVRSDAKLRLMEDGGVAYNTVGVIRGRDTRAPKVVIMAHRDGYFQAASDNGAGVTTMLLLAKAMKDSGFVPKRTIVFVASTAEEYGWTDSNFDYLIGSWWSITRTHPSWPGRVAAMVNMDFGAIKGSALKAAADATLQDYAQGVADAHPAVSTVNGRPMTVEGENRSWTDAEPFALAGVPTLDMECALPDDSPFNGFVHTDYDRRNLLDYALMGNAAKYDLRFVVGLDRGLLPHSLAPRARSLRDGVDLDALAAAGVDEARLERLDAGLSGFSEAAGRYDVEKGDIPAYLRPLADRRLLALVARLNQGLLATDPYGFLLYPHQQTLGDVGHMQAAIAALDGGDGDTAFWELVSVGHTWTGMNFSRSTYAKFLRLQRPGYERLTWTALGDAAIYQNLQPALALIESGDLNGAKALIQAKLPVQQRDLDRRIDEMSSLLEQATPDILDLLPAG